MKRYLSAILLLALTGCTLHLHYHANEVHKSGPETKQDPADVIRDIFKGDTDVDEADREQDGVDGGGRDSGGYRDGAYGPS